MPLWLRANQFGSVPNESPIATLRLRLQRDYKSVADTSRKHPLRWGFVFSPVINVGKVNEVLPVEAYGKVAWRGVEIYAGRRRELTGLGDSLLSSGFYAGSGNALPLNKIKLQTLGYRSFPFLKRFFAVSAGWAHGWFPTDYMQGAYLHQKHLYVRLGRPAARVHFYGGVNHQALWGGQAEYLKQPPTSSPDGRLPSSLRDYPYVITATVPKNWVDQGYTAFDSYRIGNHLGSIDFGLSWRSLWGNWLAYYQHPYEDVSGLLFLNVPDGLLGIRWTRPALANATGFRFHHLTLEGLSTTNQSGSTFYIPGSRYQGADNYFNHGQYLQGWSYRGRAIGTPLLPVWSEIQPGLQAQSGLFFPSNLVKSLYLGAEGQWRDRVTLTARLSVGQYSGTFVQPFETPANQFSALLMGLWTLPKHPGVSLTTALALDQGSLLPRSLGGYIGLRKRWN